MGAKGIGATLTLREGNFFANAKKAESATKNLKTSFNNTSRSVKSLGDGFGSLAKKVVGVVAAYAGVRQIVSFSKDCIEAANGQIKAEERLDQLMMNVKGTTKEAVESVKAYSSELQKVTTVGDEVSMVGASQLATFQMQSDSIKKLMPAMNDLAVSIYGVNVSQDQMQQTANLVGKVMNGNVGALTRVGVTFNAAQEKILKTGTEAQKAAALVDVLGQNFGGLAERMAQTPEGRIVQFKNAWGDVKEEIGARLYPAVTNLFGWLSEHIPIIQEKITGVVDKVSPYIQNAVELIKVGMQAAGNTIAWVKDNWGWLAPVIGGVIGAIATYNAVQSVTSAITGLSTAKIMTMTGAQLAHAAAAKAAASATTAFGTAVTFLTSPITLIALAIGTVIAAVVLLYKKCDWFRNFVNTFLKSTISLIKNVVSSIKASLQPVIQAISGAFKEAWELIKVIWKFVQPYFQMQWNNIKAIFSVVSTFIGGAFKTAWEVIKFTWGAVTGFFAAIWNTIAGIFSVVKDVLTGDWFGAWEGIKGIVNTWTEYFSGIWGGIKGVFQSAGSWFGDTFRVACDAIKSVFSNIREFFAGIWSSITGGAKNMVNGIIGAVNKLIGGVNRISFTLPEVMGGATVGFNIPTIPMLAKGGYINRAGSVIVGEKGPELLNLNRGASVVPLGKGGGTVNKNTFYINITPKDSDEEAVNELVRKVKIILDTM